MSSGSLHTRPRHQLTLVEQAGAPSCRGGKGEVPAPRTIRGQWKPNSPPPGRQPDEEREQPPRHGHQGVAPLPLLPPSAGRRAPARDQRRVARRRSTSLGLALGLYVALVLRTLLYGDTVYWSLLWRAGPGEWLPFLVPVTVLVFLQAGLYAAPRASGGSRAGRLVADPRRADHPLVRPRHGLRLHDDRADPDGGRHVLARDRPAARRLLVVRARADEGGGHPAQGRPRRRGPQPARAPARARRHARRPRLRVPRRRLAARRCEDLPQLGLVGGRAARRSSSSCRPDELILSEADFDERTVLDVVERAHRARRQGATCSEHDRAARPEGRVRAGPGRAALRPAPADPDRVGLGREARLRPPRQRPDRRDRPAALAAHRARDQARLARARVLRRPPDRRRRARVRDAQVPHHGRRRADAAGGARGRERGVGRAVQDPRRPARDARRPRPAAVLDRRAAAARQRRCAAR